MFPLTVTNLHEDAAVKTTSTLVSASLPNLPAGTIKLIAKSFAIWTELGDEGMGWRETYRSRPSNIPQIIASARGPTNSSKKGPNYYTSGPELLTSLKGSQVAVLRGDGGTHIVLDGDRYVSSPL